MRRAQRRDPAQADTTWPDPEQVDPVHGMHPDHELFRQIREGVHEIDAELERDWDGSSIALTHSLLRLAKAHGLASVDHVELSRATPGAAAGLLVFLVRGELDDPAHVRVSMPTDVAVATTPAQARAWLGHGVPKPIGPAVAVPD